jgi:hypothetical protein
MRQQLGGMHLLQDSSVQRGGSAGAVSESVGASVVQVRPQQQQRQQQLQQQQGSQLLLEQQQQPGGGRGSDGGPAESVAASVGAGAATASERVSPAEEVRQALRHMGLTVLFQQ